MCSMSRGWNVLLQWLENQSQQNWRFSRTQLEPRWKVGMTGPLCAMGRASCSSIAVRPRPRCRTCRGRRSGRGSPSTRCRAARRPRPSTVSAVTRRVTMSDSASRRHVRSSMVGSSSAPPLVDVSSMSRSSRNSRRLRPRSAPTKSAMKSLRRAGEDLVGRAVLDELAVLEDGDPVAHLDGLVDVVRDEDDRLADLGVQAQEVVLQAVARDRVDRAERLVHEHDRLAGGHRAGDADALALAAGELARVALGVALLEADELEQLADARADALLVPAQQPRHRPDVVLHAHVREQADLLEDVADPAAQLGQVEAAHALPADGDVALGDVDQAVDHLHRGRLAAARRPDEHADLARGHAQRELADGRRLAARIALRHRAELDRSRGAAWIRHSLHPSPPRGPERYTAASAPARLQAGGPRSGYAAL